VDKAVEPMTLAERALRQAGYVAYVPCRVAWQRKNGFCKHKSERRIPILPGYAFIGCEHGYQPWADILGLGGGGIFHGVMCSEGKPLRVHYGDIARLEAIAKELAGAEPRALTEGEAARIITGIYRGKSVTLQRIEGKVAEVKMAFGSGDASMTIGTDMLEAA